MLVRLAQNDKNDEVTSSPETKKRHNSNTYSTLTQQKNIRANPLKLTTQIYKRAQK